jgi:hypothetical protein
VDHIILDHVGACVAPALEEMEIEWNVQGKGIIIGHFISPVIGV